jgi:hypothetical protein
LVFKEFIEGQNGVVNCLERPKWDNLETFLQNTATLKYDIQIACSTVQGNIVIGHTTHEVGPENAQYLSFKKTGSRPKQRHSA